jgi:2-polyprenyl-6-methoxyphenol hydroxylase and related FAD-dependent oxidoreductases
LHHYKIKNNTATQIFTKYGPLAFLPLSQTKTSIVYSVEKKNNFDLKEIKKIIYKFNKVYRIKKLDELEEFDLKFSFSRNLVYKNILCLGDPTHKIHPLAGQGFNMILREVKILNKLIDEKINFGLEINHSLLKDFQNKVQHFNFIFATGINLINQFFILDNKLNSKISKNLFKILNKNKIFKHYATKFADKGINFNY